MYIADMTAEVEDEEKHATRFEVDRLDRVQRHDACPKAWLMSLSLIDELHVMLASTLRQKPLPNRDLTLRQHP